LEATHTVEHFDVLQKSSFVLTLTYLAIQEKLRMTTAQISRKNRSSKLSLYRLI